ncbi:hypothetical protein BK742_11990 [Bacillus thuringiensis serovar pingluonsis]|uniref:Resolvase/invertase-type recombinase catalytic domain-containing protein n=1 Tax=Bacillus thuringiensis serovar pingluonsis TaxID=180881 RepID=A0A243BGM5_BACTU|nr:hypothetical protein BK742_11990 [Bacillus thuringiensis serovar pingluonsis]
MPIHSWLDLSEDNPYSQFLITVMGGVNQLERDFIRMSQHEGIELAKKEGKFKGRLKKYLELPPLSLRLEVRDS